MDQFLFELLKQSPSAVGCVISIVLFLRAMKDRDEIFLTALQQFHKDSRDDQKDAQTKQSLMFERNIDALVKNSERLDYNTDALNAAKDYIQRR